MQTRFIVEAARGGKYEVRDTANGNFMRFSFSYLPETPRKPRDQWNNWHSAYCFADRLFAAVAG